MGAGAPLIADRHVGDLDPITLYRILALRAEAFVVEQACVYLDPDGRDLEPGCRQVWAEEDGDVVAALRALAEPGGATRIGRVVTAPAARGRGLATALVEHVVDHHPGPWVLDAQAHLAGWYADLGFEVSGDGFLEDGIPHVPMRRRA